MDAWLAGTFSEYLPFILSKQLLSRYGARRLMVFSQAVRSGHPRHAIVAGLCAYNTTLVLVIIIDVIADVILWNNNQQ
eukprot:COSAG03_NODE_14571_length_459_cov_0.861111_1_plen_78_part_00